jgi:transposase-like protein
MATKTRRLFTDEFKQEAVSLLGASGRQLTQVAVELGVQPSMLRNWRLSRLRVGGCSSRSIRSWPYGL